MLIILRSPFRQSFQMMFLLCIPCFLCHVTLQQHLINIFIGVPLSALMDSISTFSQYHSRNTIILRHHKITFLADAHQLKINRIRSSSHRDHLTVIRLQHMVRVAQQRNRYSFATCSVILTTGQASASTNILTTHLLLRQKCMNHFYYC